jgi:hypothetical protein
MIVDWLPKFNSTSGLVQIESQYLITNLAKRQINFPKRQASFT